MNGLDGKTALVTGASAGIGRAIALRLQAEGAHVFTVQRGELIEFPAFSADLADPATPPKVIDWVETEAGRLDILVNNAGQMFEAAIEETSLEAWQHSLALNLTAPFLLIQAAMPLLAQRGGAIINIGSIEGLGANPGHVAYCATKAGLHGLTRAVAVDCGAEGVRCNGVAPGWIETDLNEEFVANQPNPEAFRQGLGRIHPVSHVGQPEDVAGLVAFLASDDAKFITGEIYRVDGGRMVKLSLP